MSKLARLVDMYARRLQLQERLTEQISKVVLESVNAKGVGVMIEARHLQWAIEIACVIRYPDPTPVDPATAGPAQTFTQALKAADLYPCSSRDYTSL